MSLEAISYGEFSLGIQKQTANRRVPLLGTIEISHRCNLACAHCYNNLPVIDHEAAGAELSVDEYRGILDELADLGCLWLLFTGGEVFARPDFLEIYTYAKRKGFIITIFTNATAITPKIADALAEWRPFRIEITLYGATRETYERVTRRPGSFERCLRGIRLLSERDLPISLKTMALTLNRHEIAAMERFAKEELRLGFKFDAMINPRIDRSLSPLAVRLSASDVVGLDAGHEARRCEWEEFAAKYTSLPHTPEEEHNLYHCGGGMNSFAIDPAGRMRICQLSQRDAYDLRQGTFREGWEHFLVSVRKRRIARPTKCTRCQIKAMCGMCPAMGELENGDPEKPVDFLCRTAHLRSYVIGAPIPAHGECEYCQGGNGFEQLRTEADALRAGAPARVELPVLGAAMPASGGAQG
jgi:radical SAM protein with 4Fe4S-binding SPASM domain